MRRRCESKGISRRRGWRACCSWGSSPAARAASNRPFSVGSPIARQASPGVAVCSRRALEQSEAARSSTRLRASSPCSVVPSPTPGSQICSTSMRLPVRVPVLSLQITLTDPSVSTADSRRTRAWQRAIRCTLNASARVTVGSRPSGTFATRIPIANTRLSSGPMPTNSRLRQKATVPIDREITVIVCTMRPTCCSSVLAVRSVPAARWATWPNSVSAPVAYTKASPRPEATLQPASTRVIRSWMGMAGPFSTPLGSAASGLAWRAAGCDSPVSTERSTTRPWASLSRQSAGIRSPSSSWMRSPGTSTSASRQRSSPSRHTCTCRGSARVSAPRVRSAWNSCQKENRPLISTTDQIAQPSCGVRATKARPPATHSSRAMKCTI